MKVKRNGLWYYTTLEETIAAANQCMDLIKKARIHTGEWRAINTTHIMWLGGDGLVEWTITIKGDCNGSFSLDIEMWGDDQMAYNFSVPSCGDPQNVINNFLGARQIDIENGVVWENMFDIPDHIIQEHFKHEEEYYESIDIIRS
jgi:hypothetical protein